MRVLLTGANGFLGSHILDELLDSGGFDVSILIRRESDTKFIDERLGDVTIHYGSMSDADALAAAVVNVNAVVHCAGKTKALKEHEYAAVNRDGTKDLVGAIADNAGAVRHFVFVSSLAVSGPGTPGHPADEAAEPHPVTAYGRSKRDAEHIVQAMTTAPWTILRPAGIYGPRDRDFLTLFRTVKRGFAITPQRGRQTLSLVYARDVAAAVRQCLGRSEAASKIYHVAADPPCTTGELNDAIATAMSKRVNSISVPGAFVYLACAVQDGLSHVRGRAHILSRHKWPEISAPGWVCTTKRIRDDIGFSAATSLEDGLSETVTWYTEQGWI